MSSKSTKTAPSKHTAGQRAAEPGEALPLLIDMNVLGRAMHKACERAGLRIANDRPGSDINVVRDRDTGEWGAWYIDADGLPCIIGPALAGIDGAKALDDYEMEFHEQQAHNAAVAHLPDPGADKE